MHCKGILSQFYRIAKEHLVAFKLKLFLYLPPPNMAIC